MKKKYLLLSFFFVFAITTVFAQRSITGKVTSAEDGSGLPGVTVLLKGTTDGTTSDLDGNYQISVPEDGGILVFSFLGTQTQEIEIGSQSVIDVSLSEDAKILGEVVVSALGIERKKDEDISSATVVNSSLVKRSGETGLLQGMAGKSSGVLITQNTGDPGAGAFIQIRGQNTILGSSSPLIIIDGVPMSNNSTIGSRGGDNTAGVVQQSRLNDIPASDIKSMTVLKGAAAAAVWGSSAANGVIVITTKNGSGNRGGNVSVDIDMSVSIDQVNREHEKQSSYGQGNGGKWNPTTGSSWGDKIANRSGAADVLDNTGGYFVSEQTGKTYYAIKEKNSKQTYNDVNRDQIFRNGLTQNYSMGINYSGNDGSNTYLSYSRLDQKGVINGNSDYLRNTFRMNHTRNLTDNLQARINSSYININSNRIQTGSNLSGLYLGYLRTAPDFDNTDYSGTYYSSPDDKIGVTNSHRAYRGHIGRSSPTYANPGWVVNKNTNTSVVNRFLVSPELKYNILDNLSITARYGLDYYTDNRETHFPYRSSADWTQGGYYLDDVSEKIQNVNIFVNGDNNFSDAFKLNWILGYMIEDNQYREFGSSTNNFLNPDPSKHLVDNAVNGDILAAQYLENSRKNSVYYSLNFNLIEDLFIDITGRAERSSTLQDLNFYPSFTGGYVLSNKIIPKNDILTFVKLRASWGQVGIAPTPYRNQSSYITSTAGSEGWGDYLNGANYGGTVARSSTQGNPNLKVETITEFEVGSDFRFLKDKLSIGLTYYNRTTTDGILRIEVPPSSGYSFIYKNAAEISNKGFEIDYNYEVINNGDFTLNVFGTYTQYKNIVEKLPDVSRYILNGFTSTSSAVVEGYSFGALYGGKYLRDENGKIKLDENNFPLIDDNQGVIGDPNPDWRGSLGSSMSYKGINFSFLFETSQGNQMWGGTQGVLYHFGIHPNTAVESTATQDLKTYSGKTIAAGTTFRGNIHNFGGGNVALDEGWYSTNGGGFGDLDEQFVKDASWTKLREVTLSYNLPSSLLKGTGIKGAQVGFTGRNLLIITDFAGVDPEINLTGASKGRGLDYFTNPGTRSYLFNLKLNF